MLVNVLGRGSQSYWRFDRTGSVDFVKKDILLSSAPGLDRALRKVQTGIVDIPEKPIARGIRKQSDVVKRRRG